MRGQMMSFPLTLPALLRRAESLWRHTPIVTRAADFSIRRTTYGECLRRARQFAVALRQAGVRPGDRVATFCWNDQPHLEAYFGIPMSGAVLHTLNLRLHPNDLGYIVEHAEDAAIVVDASLARAFAAFRDRMPNAKVIMVGDGERPAGAIEYESFLDTASADDYRDEVTDQQAAAAMCYTSGTTGRPKGVVYSHYALCLHSFALATSFGVSQADTVLPIVPMFHANAWGFPFICALLGAPLVLPGPHMDAESLLELIASERVTFSAGVPTIWATIARTLEAHPGQYDLSALRRVLCGGSAVPAAMIRTFHERHAIRIIQAWGMTETGPFATGATVTSAFEGLPQPEQYTLGAKQGWAAPFIELRVMTPDGVVAADGRTIGEIEIRGPWVIDGYYKDEAPDRFSADGWFRTGDIATMDESGCIQVQDRAKDLIKSGGEWISSVALESALAAHPAVADVAVIAVPHPHWQERPLALVVLKSAGAATAEELRAFLAPQFTKWSLPDAFEFVAALPRTPTGKLLKYALRDQYRGYTLPAGRV